ncbi:MAG: hypothetical protein Q8Q09_15075 [Deltaproteobacteria bacterium]|nr:hypothetical protein [Deltaproteobacteria bacterium]
MDRLPRILQALAFVGVTGCSAAQATQVSSGPLPIGRADRTVCDSPVIAQCNDQPVDGHRCPSVGARCSGQSSSCVQSPGSQPSRCSGAEWTCDCAESEACGGPRWRCMEQMHPAGPQMPPELPA